MSRIRIEGLKQTGAVDPVLANCGVFSLGKFSGGLLELASGSNLTYEIWVCDTKDGTYRKLTKEGGTAITVRLDATTSEAIPPEAYAARYFKLKGAAGSVDLLPCQ